jgi:hypothetical protein
MARIARVVVPDLPHHVTQRGNRREPVFFEADDYRLYRQPVAAVAQHAGTAVWAYCLLMSYVASLRLVHSIVVLIAFLVLYEKWSGFSFSSIK